MQETKKVLCASFIKEIHFTMWFANIIMVLKSSGKWMMRIKLKRNLPKGHIPAAKYDPNKNHLTKFDDDVY